MNEKRYLNWFNKIGYGSGDIAGNVVYAFLSAFVMIYLTDTVGMNAGVVGTLMMFSKIFDGVTDIFFGSMIDKTHSRLGKARPWMLYAYIGCAVLLVAIYSVPSSISVTAQYVWFFITYSMLNAVFYTANNIAYSALTALITKNRHERVQMGSIRFIFAFSTSMLIQSATVGLVSGFGGGTAGWRTVAIIYAIIGFVVNSFSVFSVKELPPEELALEGNDTNDAAREKIPLLESLKLLLANKYYLIICGVYICCQISSALTAMGIYYMTYVLGDANLLGRFSVAMNAPIIVGLLLTPAIVNKAKGIYKVNLSGYMLATVFRALVIVAGLMRNVPLMLIFTALAYIGTSPLQGDLNALIAICSEYTWRTKGKRIDGTMYSCTSLGTKIGGGVGTALGGWLLAAGGYVTNAVQQSQSCINMLNFMYLWAPFILNVLITLLLYKLKVEQANAKWDETHAAVTKSHEQEGQNE
ncbi:MAG: MFS transporter [Enterocloster citroniae]|nr:MFS transporter [Enterocloster citroniae]